MPPSSREYGMFEALCPFNYARLYINARPAATHSLADARPLVFRPMCPARPDPSSVSVAISLVLPIYCSCYLNNLDPRNSVRLFPDLTNQVGRVIFASEHSKLYWA